MRLQKLGSKHRSIFRIVATESTSPRDGRFIEIVGTYHPQKMHETVTLKEERVRHWLNVGAQPSDTVRSILTKKGLLAAAAAAK